jgi:hypothetical protein
MSVGAGLQQKFVALIPKCVMRCVIKLRPILDFCTREIRVFLGPTFLFDSLPKRSLHFTSDAEAGLRRYNHPGPWPMPHTLIPRVFFTTKLKVYYVTSYV